MYDANRTHWLKIIVINNISRKHSDLISERCTRMLDLASSYIMFTLHNCGVSRKVLQKLARPAFARSLKKFLRHRETRNFLLAI